MCFILLFFTFLQVNILFTNASNTTNAITTTTTSPITTTQVYTTVGGCSFTKIETNINTQPQQTLVSTNVLYPPFYYSLPSSPIIEFPATQENHCNISTLSDYSSKIVTINVFDIQSQSCSFQQTTLNFQSKGALGVIFVNNNDNLFNIDKDINANSPIIPSRMITLTGMNLIKLTSNVMISFDCVNDFYPEILCGNDLSGINYHYVGNYQKQGNNTYNNHPIYEKPKYLDNIFGTFIYLNNNGYWELSGNVGTPNNNIIYGVCNETKNEPQNCNNWNINGFTLSPGICNIGDSVLCLDTNTANGDSLKGNYIQVHNNVSIWLKELTPINSDEVVLYWSQNIQISQTFYSGWLLKYATQTYVCLCRGTNVDNCDINGANKYEPYKCTQWFLSGNSASQLIDLDNNRCNVTHSIDSNINPQNICIKSNNSSYFQYLFGVWTVTQQTYNGYPVYQSSIFNELKLVKNDILDSWIIVDGLPSSLFISSNVIAYCNNDGKNTPDTCTKCWKFQSDSITATDCAVTATIDTPNTAKCVESITYDIDKAPKKICGEFDRSQNLYRSGNYLKQSNKYNGYPYYKWDGNTNFYIYFDNQRLFWVYSNTLNTIILYAPDKTCMNGVNCVWYEAPDRSGFLYQTKTFTTKDCDSNDALAFLENPLILGLAGGSVVFIILLLCFVCCIRAKCCKSDKDESFKGTNAFPPPSGTSPKRPQHTGGDVQMGVGIGNVINKELKQKSGMNTNDPKNVKKKKKKKKKKKDKTNNIQPKKVKTNDSWDFGDDNDFFSNSNIAKDKKPMKPVKSATVDSNENDPFNTNDEEDPFGLNDIPPTQPESNFFGDDDFNDSVFDRETKKKTPKQTKDTTQGQTSTIIPNKETTTKAKGNNKNVKTEKLKSSKDKKEINPFEDPDENSVFSNVPDSRGGRESILLNNPFRQSVVVTPGNKESVLGGTQKSIIFNAFDE